MNALVPTFLLLLFAAPLAHALPATTIEAGCDDPLLTRPCTAAGADAGAACSAIPTLTRTTVHLGCGSDVGIQDVDERPSDAQCHAGLMLPSNSMGLGCSGEVSIQDVDERPADSSCEVMFNPQPDPPGIGCHAGIGSRSRSTLCEADIRGSALPTLGPWLTTDLPGLQAHAACGTREITTLATCAADYDTAAPGNLGACSHVISMPPLYRPN